MKRVIERNTIREFHKDLRKSSLNKFYNFMKNMVNDHIQDTEDLYTQTLRQEFGFGDKRIERFKAAAQQIYDTGRESDDNQD